MAWVSRKTMDLGGTNVRKGQLVPQSVVDGIPTARLGTLVRVGYLQEVPAAHAAEHAPPPRVMDEEGEGEFCPECGSGPFARLSQHMTRMHGDESEV